MEKVLFTTKHKKPIYQGDTYFAVLNDNTIIESIADAKAQKDDRIVVRFLSRTGATKYVANNPIIAKPVEVVKSEEEKEEEKLSKLNILEQVSHIKSEEDYKKWVKRNKITFTKTSTYFTINTKSDMIFRIDWSMRGGFSCCGAYEIGSHSGSINSNYSRYFSKAMYKTLCKYIVTEFELALRTSANNYGIVTYVRDAGDVGSASGRIGMMLDESKLFQKTATFRNPNSNRSLDMYTITDAWQTN